jgi:hypothetical protein
MITFMNRFSFVREEVRFMKWKNSGFDVLLERVKGHN